ncbi:PH domain-containing protein [Lacticaseibacillus hulanensis]|jgi:membrane protein YdbS with pleckstrin-like domain|uniref:PH domain-containing protein n=1 Tax=Lacticaseibacillus hulanensis TaxID=2493111 RepID=UPI000FDC50F5|nr:PH domain-containing protein [Lacticaseibacillus hulanensis]
MNDTHKLPERIKRIWYLSTLGSFIFGLVVSGGVALGHMWWDWPMWLVFAALGLTVVESIIELALVPYRYAFSGYRITDTAVEMSSGLFFKKHVAIPIAKIQNVTLKAGPLMQAQHLEQVVIATAATDHDIEGVEPQTAAKLRDRIMARAIEVRDDAL